MTYSFNTSDIIATIALLASVGSIIYAKKSADAAQVNNRISLHQPRKDIYDGLLQFRSLFVGMDFHPTDEEINAFYIKSVAPAQIYLNSSLSKRIHNIYEQAWHMYRKIDDAENEENPEVSKWDSIELFQAFGRTELEQAIREVTEEISLGNT